MEHELLGAGRGRSSGGGSCSGCGRCGCGSGHSCDAAGEETGQNVAAGGTHLHHYLWGILLLAGVAIFGLVDRSPRARTWMGIALGIALGLIVDEAALLITLDDVYWQSDGWPSIAIAVSIIGVVGTGLALTRSGAEKPRG